jgi:YVTN family beta-propeller protein
MKYFKFTFLVAFFVLLLTNCGGNQGTGAPLTPGSPAGPVIGIPNFIHAFRASTTDPDGDNISYQFDWGDGTASLWSDFIPSGDTVSMNRVYWGKGTFPVRVHAQDETENISEWSDPLYLLIGFPDEIVSNFSTGIMPTDIEVLPNGQRIYVTNYDDGTVRVINGTNNSPMGDISVGTGPIGVTALPNSQYVYIMLFEDDYVIALPTGSGTRDTIPIPYPRYAAALPNGEYVYVTSFTTSNVYVIRTSDNTLVDSINVGGTPHAIETLPNGQNIYVSTSSSNTSVIRTSDNTIVDNLPVGGSDMDVSSDGQNLYVCSNMGSRVFVAQTSSNTVIDTVDVNGDPQGLCLHPSGLLLYVTDHVGDEVSVIYTPTNKVIENIEVFDGPSYIDSSPDGEYIYVLHNLTYAVAVIGYSE